MWRSRSLLPAVLLAAVALCVLGLASAQPVPRPAKAQITAEAQDGPRLAPRVQGLLKERCLACHGGGKEIAGRLDLRTRAGMLRGGAAGRPALVPGQPERSRLYVAVTRKDRRLAMPPKENDRLSAEQVALIRRWIAAGAPWPDPAGAASAAAAASGDGWGAADGVTVATSGGQTPEWTRRRYNPADLWAYRPIRRPSVPRAAVDAALVLNPIDAFIQQRLAPQGIRRLAAPADRRTLIRRATFDLTGLPPSPGEVEAFAADWSPDAYRKLVERLLASPHYGEQQARHWLDVARYADTSGFSNDFERPNAWRYRDYVVRSFNDDTPYDRFVMEQLAGDELDADDPELPIAVGFLRMGPWEHTGMTVAAATRQQFLDDVTHNVGAAFLGQGLRCASCHDHKFDPVPTKDYYRIQAVFAATQLAERPVAFLPAENTASFADGKARAEKLLAEAREFLDGLKKKNEAALAALLQERGVARFEELPAHERGRRDDLGLTKEELTLRKVYERRRQQFERAVLRFEPYAFSVFSGAPYDYRSVRALNPLPEKREGAVPEVRILVGGSLEAPGEVVTPGVLSAMHGANEAVKPTAGNTIPRTAAGRRLALARWIASRENTLTARVVVNRVWQQHFGRGLVATPNNFGKMGARPTHPELLDWLATWFMEKGWSLKKLHRLIMASATYRQSGAHPEMARLRRIDARNTLLAYFPPRRLAAEELRDAMLAVCGELNRVLGGPGVFPEIHWEVALQPRHLMGAPAPAYLPSPTARERNRRTLYAFRLRTLADPLLEVFNRPGSETSCERRDEATVTPQALALFNSEFVHRRALAFAASLERQSLTLDGRIERAFRLAYGRPPTADEREACRAHVARMTVHHREHAPHPAPLPSQVRRQMAEELTGETVQWDEVLTGMEGYERDLMPWEVGPETRALAELCLVLLNSNEFLYVR